MNSNPKRATTRWDPLDSKTNQDCDKTVFDPKMRSPLAVNNIGVMFSVHGDSIYSPRGH